ncbi:MAG: translocation/assembly module TamB domain-containing protein, partial [Acidobacteriaceae bacterium]
MMSQDTQSADQKRRRLWMKAFKWIAFSIGCLIFVVVIVFFEALHSPRLHKYLLAMANKNASSAMGVPVEVENYALHLSNLSVDVYGVTIHGAAPYPNPPLLQIRHVAASVRVVSLLSRKWYLNNVRIDSPVVHLFSDANGESNLPKLGGNSGGGNTVNFFNLGIRHVLLDRGEIYYQNKKAPLEADLHDLEFRTQYHVLENKYAGMLSYRNGHLQAGTLDTIPHSLDASFEAAPTRFRLIRANLTSGSSNVLLSATLEDYGHPKIQGHYQAKLNGSELQRILNNSSVPSGWIETSGSVAYRDLPGQVFIQRLVVDGTLSSRQLDLDAGGAPVRLNTIRAAYSLAGGNLDVRNFRGQLLGGELSASLSIRDITGNSNGELKADARQLSLASLKRLAPSTTAARKLSLAGIVDASTTVQWGKNLEESLVANVNATIHGAASGQASGRAPGRLSNLSESAISRDGTPQSPTPAAIPVNGQFHAVYTAASKRLALSHSYLRLPKTTLTMNGVLGGHSQLALDLESSDLGELESIADIFHTSKQGGAPVPLDLRGKGSFKASVTGSTVAPHLTGNLSASNLRVKGTAWHTLRTNVDLRPSAASLGNGELLPASGGGRITFNAGVGLHNWKFQNTSALHADLGASKISVGTLSKIFGSQPPVTGTLAANIHLRGSELNPTGHGNLSVTHAQIYGEPVQLAEIDFNAMDGQVHANLTARLPAGTIKSVVSFRPNEKTYTAQVTSSGLDLSQLQTLRDRDMDVKGHLQLSASGQGTLDDPQFTASISIPRLEVQDQAITAIAMQMDVADHVANATLSAQEGNTPIQAQANVKMVGDYPIQASLNTQPMPLEPFLAMYVPSEAGKLNGVAEVHATLEGPLKQKGLLEAHITLPILKIGYGTQVQVAAQTPVHVDYKDGVLGIQHTTIKGTDVDLQVQGSIPMRGHGTPSLLLAGAVNLKIAQLFDPDIKSSGELRLNINGFGGQNHSGMAGTIELTNANVINGDWPIGLRRGNAVLTLSKDRVNISSLTGEVGGGKLTGQGSVTYRPHTVFDLGIAAKGVRLLYPEGVREELDADLRFTGTPDDALLGGKVNLNDLSFTPNFDLTSFISQFGGVSAPPSQGFAQNVNLNLSVSTPNDLNLVSRTLSVGGTANLEVRGTAARPVILGRVNVSNGDVIFNGDRYLVSGGT